MKKHFLIFCLTFLPFTAYCYSDGVPPETMARRGYHYSIASYGGNCPVIDFECIFEESSSYILKNYGLDELDSETTRWIFTLYHQNQDYTQEAEVLIDEKEASLIRKEPKNEKKETSYIKTNDMRCLRSFFRR